MAWGGSISDVSGLHAARSIPRSAFGFTGLPGTTNLFCAIVGVENVVADFRLAVTLCSGNCSEA